MKELEDIMDLRRQERELKTKLGSLRKSVRELSDTVNYEESLIDSRIEEARNEFIKEETEEIRALHQPKIDELELQIDNIKESLEKDYVDETEELAAARKRKEYLDSAALVVEKYYNVLKNTSTPYFVDIAYNEERYNLKGFRQAFKGLPNRIRKLQTLSKKTYPFPFNAFTRKNINSSIYLTAIFGSILVPFKLPSILKQAVDRAHYLHESSQMYHKMMHTLVSFQHKTDEVINELFEGLLISKRDRLTKELEIKEAELAKLNQLLKDEFDSIEYDESNLRRSEGIRLGAQRSQLKEAEEEMEIVEEKIKEIEELIEKAKLSYEQVLELERSYYLTGQEERSVVLPEQLLYDYNSSSNSKFEFKPGLYLYSDRETVYDFMQLTIFQIRNIMGWGTVQFRILDLLGAEKVAPLMLRLDGKAKNQDITISTLREDKEHMIDLVHDMLERRRVQVLSMTTDLGAYNTIQKESGSATIAYQIVYIVLDDNIKFEEKLIQLIHNGTKLGLIVLVFAKDELLTIQVAKNIETFFESFVELSPTGLSSYSPTHYREMLEQLQADKKLGM